MLKPINTKNIFIPGFEFGVAAGVITLLVAAFSTYVVFASTFFTELLASILKDVVVVMFLVFLFMHYICGIIMIISAFLIKHEEHSLAGSIMIMIISLIGVLIGAGLFLGAGLGIIGGVLGMKEHQKLLHHKF